MNSALARILTATAAGVPDDSWTAARLRVETDREAVERLINAPRRPAVYGFTTLLGPLDHVDSSAYDQHDLLAAHLLGRAHQVDGRVVRLITSFKIEQLAHGGSGISPGTYARVLASIERTTPCAIAWQTSYGSGDVVPAAWWIAGTVGRDVDALPAGDLIALLSGHFISSAVATAALLALIRYLGDFMAVAGTLAAPARAAGEDDAAELIDLMRQSYAPRPGPVQRPVSIRDSRVFAEPAVRTLRELAASLDHRGAGESANPLFRVIDHQAQAMSQASFLDVGLTLQVVAAQQLVLFLMGAAQRFTVAVCNDLETRTHEPHPEHVQPPKVAQALLENARAVAAAPASYSGSQSGGVEDLWDGSLIASTGLLRVLALAEEQMELLGAVVSTAGLRRLTTAPIFIDHLVAVAGLPTTVVPLVGETEAGRLLAQIGATGT